MRVYLRAPDGKKKDDVEMDINADELIESVRRKIGQKKGVDESFKVIFRGSTLKDDRTLRSYDVMEDSVLTVQSQFHGQYMPMGVTPAHAQKLDDDDVDEPEAKRQALAPISTEDITEATIDWLKARVATYGEKGMRRQMEDEYLICKSLKEQCPALPKERDFALFSIFDGHGGKQVAMFVKNFIAVELANAFNSEEGPREEPLSDKKLKAVVEATFQRIDNRIATELTGCFDGCTAVVLLVNAERCICLNLGDSMAYLNRHNAEGEIQAIPLQARQHKCWMMKEKDRIFRSGGAVENGRINGVLEVSRAFGDISMKKFGVLCTPEYMKFKLDRAIDKFLLVGCDGFWNAWTPAEALEFAQDLVDTELARSERDGDEVDLIGVCRELTTHVIEEKKAQDNVSVLVVQFMQ
jgi:integrin-linked kinase-associated serine/threonine phosphatase 2C